MVRSAPAWLNLDEFEEATSNSPIQKDHKNVSVKRVILIRPKKGNRTVLGMEGRLNWLYFQPSMHAGLKIWMEL